MIAFQTILRTQRAIERVIKVIRYVVSGLPVATSGFLPFLFVAVVVLVWFFGVFV